jgi:restriction endonuclease S subunit
VVGRVSIFAGKPDGVVASDLTIRIWVSNDVKPEFLSGYLSFLYLSGYWRERAGGASGTMKKITRGQLAEESLPMPAIDVQEVVAEQIEYEIAAARNLRQTLSDRLAALEKLPAALLREAFAGTLG